MPNVAIYTRLSKDPTGAQTATPRQERLCRSYADARAWTVSEVYEDVDLSAYSGIRRPAFDLLRAAVEADVYDGVLVWKLDRLVRRPSDFEWFWSVCEYRQVFLASVTEPVDSSTEMGLAIVRLLVTFAGLESSTKSIREKAKERELAEAGRPHACRQSFGWVGRYAALEPTHAGMIQEAARRLLNGESLKSVADDWNALGRPLPRSASWSAGTIRSILRKQALTGDRAYHGEVVATDCWPAVLDRSTFARVQLLLADRARPANGRRSLYLLSGLLYCSRCRARMTGNKDRGRRAYACPRPPRGCSGTSVQADVVEAWILAECDRRDAAPTGDADSILEQAVRLRQLAKDYYSARVISRDEFLAARAALAADEPAIYADRPDACDTVMARLYVANRIAKADVQPGRASRPFDPARLEVTWRSEPLRPVVRLSRPGRGARRLDADEWLTGDEARHVLCDMNHEAFGDLIRTGRLKPWRSRGARFRRSEVDTVLDGMRHKPQRRRASLASESSELQAGS